MTSRYVVIVLDREKDLPKLTLREVIHKWEDVEKFVLEFDSRSRKRSIRPKLYHNPFEPHSTLCNLPKPTAKRRK